MNPLPNDAAQDQSGCPDGHYRRLNGMIVVTPEAQSTQSPLDLAAIEGMDIDELRTLCKRMARQCGLIACLTQEETAQAMLDTLAETALRPISSGLNMRADIQSRIAAIDKWLDRTRGKPAQYIEQKSLVAVMALDERKIEAKREAENLLNLLSKCDNNYAA